MGAILKIYFKNADLNYYYYLIIFLSVFIANYISKYSKLNLLSHITISTENKFFNDFTMPQLIEKIPHNSTKTNGNNFYLQFLNKKN